MLTIPLPDGFSHGDLLAETVDAEVYVLGDELVFPELDERSRSRVEDAVAAHAPPAIEPLPTYAELVAEVRGMKERAAAAVVTGDAAKIRDAVAGPPDSRT